MPTVTGTITSCRRDKKGFQLDKGNWYNRYDGAPLDWLDRGIEVEVEYEPKGGHNIFTTDPKQLGGSPTQSSSGRGYNKGNRWHAYEDKEYQEKINRRIVRQNALNNAASLYAATMEKGESIDEDSITNTADRFVEWVESD